MIPSDSNVDKIIPHKEIFVPAWNVGNGTSRFFTKNSVENWNKKSFNLGAMTLASMSSPEYFEPAKINKDEVFISGDNVAKSPAFFSYMFTKKHLKVQN